MSQSKRDASPRCVNNTSPRLATDAFCQIRRRTSTTRSVSSLGYTCVCLLGVRGYKTRLPPRSAVGGRRQRQIVVSWRSSDLGWPISRRTNAARWAASTWALLVQGRETCENSWYQRPSPCTGCELSAWRASLRLRLIVACVYVHRKPKDVVRMRSSVA